MPAQPVTRYLHSIYTFILFFNEYNFIYIIYHLVVQRQAGNMANLSLCFCAISPMFRFYLILPLETGSCTQSIFFQSRFFQILSLKTNCMNLTVIIRFVIINPLISVDTARIRSNVLLSFRSDYGASYHTHPVQNMEKLRNVRFFFLNSSGIPF